MSMIKIASLGFSGVLLGLFLKQSRSPYAELVSLVSCLIILFCSVQKLSYVFSLIRDLRKYLSIDDRYIPVLLKIIGITYIADFSSAVCKDAGYQAIAGQIELFGKITILTVSTPIILALLALIDSLL